MKRMLVLLLVISVYNLQAQELNEASYKLEFLRADYTEKKNHNEIKLFFKYTPKEGNKTLISGKLTYSLGENGIEKTEILEKSKHGIVVHGQNIRTDESDVYKLFKDSLDFTSEEEFFILEFKLNDITEKYINKMTFTYGLWEPSNPEIRFEKKFYIDVQK